MNWKPLEEAKLWDYINDGIKEMYASEIRFYEAIKIRPQKWVLEPWGERGGGFWVVGIIGNIVLWYNDVEEGFNHSTYEEFGEISEYWCEQDELEFAVRKLRSITETGSPVARPGPPKPL